MESWPNSTSTATHVSKSKKAKSQIQNSNASYPVVEYGGITSANLYHKTNHLKWTFLTGEETERRLTILRKPTKVFPATRRVPLQSGINVSRTAEQATQFLRLHYPDADFPQDIVRSHIAEDLDARHRLRSFDPLSGNLLTAFDLQVYSGDSCSYVAFPMGETGGQLNISPVSSSEEADMIFKPVSLPAWTSLTPILQLASTTPNKTATSTTVAVRTHTSTSFLQIYPNPDDLNSVEVSELGSLSSSQTGIKPIVDVMIGNGKSSRAFVVNSEGLLYTHDIPNGLTTAQVYGRSSDTNDDFFRLHHGSSNDACLLLDGHGVVSVDLRGPNSTKALYQSKATDVLTDLSYAPETSLLTLSSTSEVLWLDHRFDKRPIFSVKHGRKCDRHLQLSTFNFSENPLTFLTSRYNGLINVYDTSYGEGNLVHLHTPPYALPPVPIVGSARVGCAWLRYPDEEYKACFMQLSDRGSLHRMDVNLVPTDEEPADCHTDDGYEWSTAVQRLETENENVQEDSGPTGERGYEETDLVDAYSALFCEDASDDDDDPTAAYDLLETMPVFWQKQEEPVEHMLTTFDIAFRSGTDPRDPSRADFFTGTPLDSVRGYRALKQERIPLDILKRKSASHWDMRSVHKRFVPEMQQASTELCNKLSQYDLIADDDRSAASYRRESEAKDQLALDLSLSLNVFSSRVIETAKVDSVENDLETMSTAAEAMSLDVTEPPSVKFGFLDPIPVEDAGQGTDTNGPSMLGDSRQQTLKLPLGVRLLLSEWTIGDDPQDYDYVDPYDVNAAPPRPAMHTKEQPRKRTPPPVASQPSRIQKPPTIAVKTAPTAPPHISLTQPSRPAPVPSITSLPQPQSQQSLPLRAHQTGSQPTQTGWSSNSQSRIPMMSTQVLPGPHGGRPQPAKKKPPKKRVGGF